MCVQGPAAIIDGGNEPMKTIRCEVLRQALLVAACAVISLLTPRSSLGSPEAVSLGGSVVDSGGKAVAGAELFFRPASWWPGLGKWQPPTAKSDAAGRFQLVVTRLAENGRPAFPGMIWAFKPGYRLPKAARNWSPATCCER